MSTKADNVAPLADPAPAESPVCDLIREDIIAGRLSPNERLKVSDLARRHGVSTSPVREALQMLRGEGFVVLNPNRGARVRPVDESFVRNVFEVEMLIEPYLTRTFVEMVTEDQLTELDRIQSRIEDLNFADERKHSDLDTAFHNVTYESHYNRHMFDMWQKHREILGAISHRYPVSLTRRKAVIEEHRALLKAFREQDVDTACAVITRHVEGSGRHIIEQMRMAAARG